MGENVCNLLEYRFSWEIFADHQHVKCDSKPQVTSMAYVGYVTSEANIYLYRNVFCLASERNATSLDSRALSETTLLWFPEMILATDKITDNQQLALVVTLNIS